MMRIFAALFIVTMLYYWHNVHKCYEWKFEVTQDDQGHIVELSESVSKTALDAPAKKEIKEKPK